MKFQSMPTSFTHRAMNHDELIEIFLHLPLRSLLRLRTVCKLWCDVIDSQYFRKLHIQRRNIYSDEDLVHLRCYFLDNNENLKLCMEVLVNGISFKSHDLPAFNTDHVRVAGAVKGLVCVSSSRAMQPIAICNPFLGLLKILPRSPSASCHSSQCIIRHNVGVGFDEDYKVVQLVSCHQHPCLQANLYLKRTNSWREVAIDQELVVDSSIMSLYKNGSFAHWKGGLGEKRIILSFDMKNEVFRKITLPGKMVTGRYEIVVKNGLVLPKEMFVVCVLENGIKVRIYESRWEGSELIWTRGLNLASPHCRSSTPSWRSDNGVIYWNLEYWVDLKVIPLKLELVRHSNAHKIMEPFKRSVIVEHESSVIIEYEGSLISP